MKKFAVRLALLAGMTFGVAQGAFAQLTVFDPSNFLENMLSAMKAVQGEIYQNTNIGYQYQMMQNQLLQAKNLDPTSMKSQYDQITSDMSKTRALTNTLTSLYGNLQQGGAWLGHVQTLISTSGKSPTQWFQDMSSLNDQNNKAATDLFQMGNDVFTHTQQLAQRRQELQSQLSQTPTQQATAELTTHYLDIVTSQNADMMQMMAAKQQRDAQQSAVATAQNQAAAAAAQSFMNQQNAERAALGYTGQQ
ncbi:type VI secretion protein [Paraburkholderia rhizosphaerae]|uniref:P-type conjugative transfer protein TrbJ n=1 Tax=Paraburkholderia rhizosphaerae TaxID=480658 RepID=A0A4R8LPB6_9BURK|nr:type VI secretion protein [Paraburkholderia rhizosphaerae]TDY48076.1 P-type conjugative transfer protein TrbJ [Paraburkholderia rhizosphaerae]